MDSSVPLFCTKSGKVRFKSSVEHSSCRLSHQLIFELQSIQIWSL